jgi:ABC-type transporter Mla MlaB component
MFRITTWNNSGTIRIVVEGKLTRACIAELDNSWQSAKLLEPHGSILMDLTGVSYIDASGKQLLARMHEQGTEFLCAGLMTKFLIEEIKSAENATACEKPEAPNRVTSLIPR